MRVPHAPRALAAVAAVGLVFAGCSPSESALTGELAEGQALYQANCMECHGERALGDGPLGANLPIQPPSLLEHLAHHTQAQLVRLIRAGIPPAMPAPALDDAQVQLVIDYVWTLVPEAEVAALREMQSHVEMGHMPAMDMPGMQMGTPPDSAGGAAPMNH